MDNDHIAELFAGLGPVSIRKMFGGKGIYFEGVIFAIEIYREMMLKADAQTAPDFADAGCRQWVYTNPKHGKQVAMPYWSIPDSAMDDPDEMAEWAKKACDAGRRAASQ